MTEKTGDVWDVNDLIPKDEQSAAHPGSYDRTLAQEKGLLEDHGYNDRFFFIQGLYRIALEEHLLDALDLEKYDKLLAEHGIVSRAEDRQNFYQRYSTMNLSYLYLRNNIHIERLSEDDLAVFEKHWEEGNPRISDEIREAVLRTWPDTIKVLSNEYLEEYNDSDDRIMSYSTNFTQKRAPSKSVAIGIAWSMSFDEQGEYNDIENDEERETYVLEEFIPQASEALSAQIKECPVALFVDNF